ncbi:MAG: NUDIX hydrolase [Candidatus Levyibacteriota bacterium]
MINPGELLFVVDEENKPIGRLPRHIVHEKGLFHRTTGIWVLNSNKEILCQRRSLKKDIEPGKMEAFFGGHVDAGQSYEDNAVREVAEELGIQVPKKDLKFIGVFKSDKPTHREFQGEFALKLTKIEVFTPEADEITSLEWHSLEELKKILMEENNPDWVHKYWDTEIFTFLEAL